MAYDYLKKLFGEAKEGEQPKAMTYAELEAAIDADKDLKLANLSAGGYVAKDRLDAKITELNGVKAQLDFANAQIQSFRGQKADIDAINQRVADWEQRYNDDTAALKVQLDQQARSHAEDMFFSGYKFTSKAARNGVLADFRAKNFKLSEDGEFEGAKTYMDGLMADDEYKAAFAAEPTGSVGNQETRPRFTSGKQAEPPKNGGKKMSLTEMMRYKIENPDADVDSFFGG